MNFLWCISQQLSFIIEVFQVIALPKGKKEPLVHCQTAFFPPKTQSSLACATIFFFFWLATNLIVLQRECGDRWAARGLEVRVLRASVLGGSATATAAASSHCCDRSAFLLAFIFSRRFTRWLLVISISSILSRAVRSWGRGQGGGWAALGTAFRQNVPRRWAPLPLSEASSSLPSAHPLPSRSCPPMLCTWRLGLRAC